MLALWDFGPVNQRRECSNYRGLFINPLIRRRLLKIINHHLIGFQFMRLLSARH